MAVFVPVEGASTAGPCRSKKPCIVQVRLCTASLMVRKSLHDSKTVSLQELGVDVTYNIYFVYIEHK
jgi:hypothetical protein